MIMGSGGSHRRPARKRKPYLKQLIKKTPIVGQLFKANSKIALEPEVLEVFCVCFLVLVFVLRVLPRSMGALGQTLLRKGGCCVLQSELGLQCGITQRWL